MCPAIYPCVLLLLVYAYKVSMAKTNKQISKIAKFGCKMLQNTENIALQSLRMHLFDNYVMITFLPCVK